MKILHKNKTLSAFTLIELSIVLVIISLIVGGVIGGKALINSAKLSAQIKQLQEYKVGFRTFGLQYDALPGDFSEATSYWPSAGTIDGNGNNILEDASNRSDLDLANYNGELAAFFQHLFLADIIPIAFDRSTTLDKGLPSMAINERFGMIAGSFSGILTSPCDQSATRLFLQIGNASALPNINAADNTFVLTPAQAKSIDTKIDNGDPESGIYCSFNFGAGATGTCFDNDKYDVAQGNVETCRSAFEL